MLPKKLLLLTALAACSLAFTNPSLCADAPPETLTRVIGNDSEKLTLKLALHPIRSENFEILVQQGDGSFKQHTPDTARTYLGTVEEHPGAIACGLLRADGTLLAQVSLEDGKTWTMTDDGKAAKDGPDVTPAWPTSVVDAGGAGSSVFAVEVGFDSSHDHFTAAGGTPDAVLEKIEFSVSCTNLIYLRDAAILHRIGKVLIRTNEEHDPYIPEDKKVDTGTLLNKIRPLWNAGDPMGSSHQLAAVLHSRVNGGLAWINVVGNDHRYSANDSFPNGDFWLVWRHEVGHNWGSLHYEGGGNPEGPTIMSNNALSRFSSSELKKVIAHRSSKTDILEELGKYTFPLPPRANQDIATYQPETPVNIDPLANDSDSNGEALTLHSFDETSALGAKLTRSKGTGPDGRDEIIYTPVKDTDQETDWFTYRIQDTSGQQAISTVLIRSSEFVQVEKED